MTTTPRRSPPAADGGRCAPLTRTATAWWNTSTWPTAKGRLSKDEYDARLEKALSARTYADLDQIVADLPATRPAVVPAVARTNGLAMASLACALAQFAFGPLATIPAIVFGHMARHQIKRTGEQGAGLALAGLILGWAAVILAILLLLVSVAMSARMHGTMH